MKLFIYKIYCIDKPDNFYIGSTNNLSSRKSHHKKNVRNKVGKRYWTKLYLFIRENGGWDAFMFEKIIEYECITKDEIRKHEQTYIDTLKPNLNSIKSFKQK
jgi:group I intron endonuclease